MTTSLMDQLISDFGDDTLGRLASALGERPDRIRTALGAVLPAILGGLASRATTTSGASALVDLIHLNQLDSPDYADIAAAVGAADGVNGLIDAGRPALDTALGGRTSAVIDWVSAFAGINRSTAISLLTLALPLVVAHIARIVGSRRLDAWSLKRLLEEQRALCGDLPGLNAALGGAPGRAINAARDAVRNRRSTPA